MRDGTRKMNEPRDRGMQLGIRLPMGKLLWKQRLHLARALSLCSCFPLCCMTVPWEKSHMNLTWEMLPTVVLLTAVSWSSWISTTKYLRLGYSQTADNQFYSSKGWKAQEWGNGRSVSSECLIYLFKMAPSTWCLHSVERERQEGCVQQQKKMYPLHQAILQRSGYHPGGLCPHDLTSHYRLYLLR